MAKLEDCPRTVVVRGKKQDSGTVRPWGQAAQFGAKGHFATVAANGAAKSQIRGSGSQTLSGYVANASSGYRGGIGGGNDN